MKRKCLVLAVSLAAVLILNGALYAQEAPGGIPAGLAGTWTGNGGATIKINANGSGSFIMGAGYPDMNPAYSATETTLSITTQMGTDIFNYVIANGSLTLTLAPGTDAQAQMVAGLSPFTKQQPGGSAEPAPAAAEPAPSGFGMFANAPFPGSRAVTSVLGNLEFSGLVLTGFEARVFQQEGNSNDGKVTVGFKNAEWQQNRIDLNLNYHFMNTYGFFARFQAWSAFFNLIGLPSETASQDMSRGASQFRVRNALVYANFLDNKIKVSTGWLYDRNPAVFDSLLVWETEVIDAESFRFTGEDRPAIRAEFKPVQGLNFGFQYFFVGVDYPAWELTYDWVDTQAYKEVGFGVTYEHNWFNLNAGLRLDSYADGMTRDDFRTYLKDYYGDADAMGIAPAGTDLLPDDRFKHPLPFGTYQYGDGHMAFLGLKLKGVKNFDAVIHAGFFGLGAFDKYGYGQFAEQFTYGISKLTLGLQLMQEFYGADVWKDNMVNSPFLQFTPYVQYQLPNRVKLELRGTYGVAQDVLDSYFVIRPKIDYEVNSFLPVCNVQLFYEMKYQDYAATTDKTGNIIPDTPAKIDHVVGFAVRLFF